MTWAPSGRWRSARVLELAARLGFAITILALPLRARVDALPHPTWTTGAILVDLLLHAVDVAIVATLGCWIVARVLDPRPVRLGPRAVWIPAASLVGLAWLTAPLGLHPDFSALVAVRLTVVAVLAIYVVNEVEGLTAIALPLGVMLAIETVVVAAQAAGQGPVGLGPIGEVQIDPGMPGSSVVTLPDGTRHFRAYGLGTHPNVLAGILACGSLLLLGAGVRRRSAHVAQVAIVAGATVALLLTFSRGGWLAGSGGFAVGLAMLAIGRQRSAVGRWLATGAITVVVVASAGWLVRDAIAVRLGQGSAGVPATEARSIDERLAQIGLGLQVIASDPLTGTGIGAIAVAMRDVDTDFGFGYYPPHVVVLTATGELGVFGGLALLALFLAPWFLLARDRGRWSPELAAASAALAGLEIASLVDFYPWVGGPGRTLTWLVLGFWVLAFERAHRPGRPT